MTKTEEIKTLKLAVIHLCRSDRMVGACDEGVSIGVPVEDREKNNYPDLEQQFIKLARWLLDDLERLTNLYRNDVYARIYRKLTDDPEAGDAELLACFDCMFDLSEDPGLYVPHFKGVRQA